LQSLITPCRVPSELKLTEHAPTETSRENQIDDKSPSRPSVPVGFGAEEEELSQLFRLERGGLEIVLSIIWTAEIGPVQKQKRAWQRPRAMSTQLEMLLDGILRQDVDESILTHPTRRPQMRRDQLRSCGLAAQEGFAPLRMTLTAMVREAQCSTEGEY
jgi:hypothetical protein